jgi:hypothetical protein
MNPIPCECCANGRRMYLVCIMYECQYLYYTLYIYTKPNKKFEEEEELIKAFPVAPSECFELVEISI